MDDLLSLRVRGLPCRVGCARVERRRMLMTGIAAGGYPVLDEEFDGAMDRLVAAERAWRRTVNVGQRAPALAANLRPSWVPSRSVDDRPLTLPSDLHRRVSWLVAVVLEAVVRGASGRATPVYSGSSSGSNVSGSLRAPMPTPVSGFGISSRGAGRSLSRPGRSPVAIMGFSLRVVSPGRYPSGIPRRGRRRAPADDRGRRTAVVPSDRPLV